MKFDNKAPNAKYWTEEKLIKHIKEYEKMFNKSTKQFLSVFKEKHYQNFEGKYEERCWYYYTKVLLLRKREEKVA